MTEKELFQIAENIERLDKEAMKSAARRQESLAKPPGSLGGLEAISIKIAGITGKVKNTIDKSCVVVMCADNGVADEKISSAPQSVTMAQTINFTRRLTGVGALAENFNSELLIVDMGVKHVIPRSLYDDIPLRDTHKIVDRRIRPATDNIVTGSAMSGKDVLRCIAVGLEMADALKNGGFDIIGVGEMGIGNTTTSAAVLSAITGRDSEATCGKGGGIKESDYMRKREIVDMVSEEYRKQGGLLRTAEDYSAGGNLFTCLSVYDGSERKPKQMMLEILAKMGGFDICAMTGTFIGAAKNKIPVVIDGYISAVAALAAAIIAPESVGYMLASHKSREKGYSLAVDILGLKPFLSLDMRLGEGSGCPIAFDVIKGACAVMNNMATFAEAEINDDYLEEIRKGNCF